jgi:MYXO-CTERM domain-containing protein
MKSVVIALGALCAVAGLAQAQPYFVRGEFNGWTNSVTPMADMGGGMYQSTITGLTPGTPYQHKATVDDWSFSAPGTGENAYAVGNASGALTINFFPNTTWSDGYQPAAQQRIGYVDPGMHGWEIMGEFNGWSAPVALMSNMGGGVYAYTVPAAPGAYQFKFRKEGDWNVSIGDTFGRFASNPSVTVNPGDNAVAFTLDLPNGRWQATSVPTPGALALLGLGGLAAARRRRA